MRRLGTLGILAAVIAVLCACLAALRVPSGAAVPEAETQENAYRMLYTRMQQDLVAMTVTLASGEEYTVESSLAFDADGNLLGVYNSLGQPLTVKGREDFALDSTSYQMMLLTAVNLPVTASYSGLDAEACGLAVPAARIEIDYHTGETIVLRIGNPTASGYGCYVQMDGDEQVHIVPVDFYQVMTRPLAEHHRLPGAISMAASSAVQIAIVRPGKENFIAANYGSADRILPWQVDAPYIHAGSTERITVFAQSVADIHAESYVTTLRDAEELAQYGLDTPVRLLVAYSDGSIRDIHLGNDAGDGYVYVRMDSSADVYLVSNSQLPGVDDAAVDALLDRFIALISADDVISLTIRTEDAVWQLSGGVEGAYAINDRNVDAEVFSEAYKAVVGMQFDKTTDGNQNGDVLCEAVFLHTDGQTTRVTYRTYDHHYLLAETSGGGRFLVRQERLADMLTILKEAEQ